MKFKIKILFIFILFLSFKAHSVPFLNLSFQQAEFYSPIDQFTASNERGFGFGLGYRNNYKLKNLGYVLSYETYQWDIGSNFYKGSVISRNMGIGALYWFKYLIIGLGVTNLQREFKNVSDNEKLKELKEYKSSTGFYFELFPKITISKSLDFYIGLRSEKFIEGTSVLNGIVGIRLFINDLPPQLTK